MTKKAQLSDGIYLDQNPYLFYEANIQHKVTTARLKKEIQEETKAILPIIFNTRSSFWPKAAGKIIWEVIFKLEAHTARQFLPVILFIQV